MTRSIIRQVDWTCARETASPGPMYEFECTTCTDRGPAADEFEEARSWTFRHVGSNPSHTGFREIITRHWRMHAADVAQVCPECRGHGEHVLPNSSAPTECPHCEGSGIAPAAVRPSAPTPEYGAPSLPILPRRYAADAGVCMPLGPVDAGTPDRTERY